MNEYTERDIIESHFPIYCMAKFQEVETEKGRYYYPLNEEAGRFFDNAKQAGVRTEPLFVPGKLGMGATKIMSLRDYDRFMYRELMKFSREKAE